jgi:hypothetical protein
MKRFHYWVLLAACSAGWLLVFLLVAPANNGIDVMIFRDAGWNLFAEGSFQSAGLPYMHDFVPRFYSHYTPVMPLLFFCYLKVFPNNAYAGTFFNFLLGIASASVALFYVLHSAWNHRLKYITAAAIAIFPIAFIHYDRPEALCYLVACACLAYAVRAGAHPAVCGLLLSLVFLVEPFGAVVVFVWIAAIFVLKNCTLDRRWQKAFWDRPLRHA